MAQGICDWGDRWELRAHRVQSPGCAAGWSDRVRVDVVYDPEAPEKCELDKDWLHSLDLADWFAKESLRRHREQNPGRVPSAFPSQGIQAGGAPAGGTRSPDSDPAAYWRQYAEEQRAAFAPAAAGAAPAASQASPDERLAEIESLHNAGALTDDEYQAKRQQVIDSI